MESPRASRPLRWSGRVGTEVRYTHQPEADRLPTMRCGTTSLRGDRAEDREARSARGLPSATGGTAMKTSNVGTRWFVMVLVLALLVGGVATGVIIAEDFSALVARLRQEKPKFAARQQALLATRYDLADRPAPGVTMSRGKPVQDGHPGEAARRARPGSSSPPCRRRRSRARISGRQASIPCRTRITKPAAWCSRSRSSTKSSGRPAATSPGSTSTSICRSICSRSSRRRST